MKASISFGAFACLILGSCASTTDSSKAITSSGGATNETTRIVYQFHDRSVPPPYHRSYKIEVDKGASSCVVDSYGEIISTRRYEEAPSFLDELTAIVASDQLNPCSEVITPGCKGGTGETLTTWSGDRRTSKRYISHCGSKRPSGNHCGILMENVKKKLAKVQCGR